MCNEACTVDFSNTACFHDFMKADLRISIKDYRRNKLLKVTLIRTPFGTRQFFVRMNGEQWPTSGEPVSLIRLFVSFSAHTSALIEIAPVLTRKTPVLIRFTLALTRIAPFLIKIALVLIRFALMLTRITLVLARNALVLTRNALVLARNALVLTRFALVLARKMIFRLGAFPQMSNPAGQLCPLPAGLTPLSTAYVVAQAKR